MKIRPATINDITFIKQCLIDSWVEHAKNEPDLLDEERMRQANIEQYYRDSLQSDKSFVLIAEVDGNVAGTIRADIQNIPGFFKHNTILYIDDVCVAPEYRQHGVAQELLQAVEAIAKQHNIRRLQGRVYEFNKSAQRLFQKMGYRAPHATWDKVLK